jgi:hypothetical protein
MTPLIHPVSGLLKRLRETEFFELFDPECHNAILAAAARYPDAEGIVCCEVLDLCSSQCGHRSALVVGPSNSWTLEFVATTPFRLGDVPSRFQYPTAYVDYRKEVAP